MAVALQYALYINHWEILLCLIGWDILMMGECVVQSWVGPNVSK